MSTPAYRKVLLKLSGQALAGAARWGIDPQAMQHITGEIQSIVALGVSLALVPGAGNFVRGSAGSAWGADRITSDHMGMLGTTINALALKSALEQVGHTTRVLSPVAMQGWVEPYAHRRAIEHTQAGHVVIFAAGTGSPLVTTDSAAALRAVEWGAELLIKATRVDGIYHADPELDPQAELLHRLDYQDVLDRKLRVMDAQAFQICQDQHVPMQIMNIHRTGALRRVVCGEPEGTWVGHVEAC